MQINVIKVFSDIFKAIDGDYGMNPVPEESECRRWMIEMLRNPSMSADIGGFSNQ